MPIPLELYSQATPNPNAYRFVASLELLPEGYVEFTRGDYATNSPHSLASLVFAYPEIERITVAANFITLTKQPHADWDLLLPLLRPAMADWLREKPAVFTPTLPLPHAADLTQVAEYFRQRILPATAEDGGGIYLLGQTPEALLVRTVGACTGCPHLPTTLRQGILEPLQANLPWLKTILIEN